MEKIKVIIKAQKYCNAKYTGVDRETGKACRCYLEEALDLAGIPGSNTWGFGRTELGGKMYEPTEKFDSRTVEEAFIREEDIRVTLVPDIEF